MLNKTNAHGISVGIFFELHPGIQSSRPRVLGVQKCRRLQNYSVFFDTCNLLREPSRGSQEKGRRASGSKIAEDRKLYVFIVTSDLLQFVSLFDLQNQDSRGVIRISRTLRCRGTEGGCKASSQKMPCTECHHQINI